MITRRVGITGGYDADTCTWRVRLLLASGGADPRAAEGAGATLDAAVLDAMARAMAATAIGAVATAEADEMMERITRREQRQ